MKSLKELWTELQINAQEVKGALAWLTILAATDIVIQNWPTQEEIAPEVWKPWADSLKLNRTYSERKKFKRAYTIRKPDNKGFFFDPIS